MSEPIFFLRPVPPQWTAERLAKWMRINGPRYRRRGYVPLLVPQASGNVPRFAMFPETPAVPPQWSDGQRWKFAKYFADQVRRERDAWQK